MFPVLKYLVLTFTDPNIADSLHLYRLLSKLVSQSLSHIIASGLVNGYMFFLTRMLNTLVLCNSAQKIHIFFILTFEKRLAGLVGFYPSSKNVYVFLCQPYLQRKQGVKGLKPIPNILRKLHTEVTSPCPKWGEGGECF